MKKFLAILLIAIVACSTVAADEKKKANLREKTEDGEVVLHFPWEIIYQGVKYVVEAVDWFEAFKTVLSWFGIYI